MGFGDERPGGRTEKGAATRDALYAVAVRMFTERGLDGTRLRDIAVEAGVSVGLLYRYFPSKEAVVMALYDDLSKDFAERAAREVGPGRWWDRTWRTLELTLQTLRPHRAVLRAALGVMLTDPEVGMFAPGGAAMRARVQGAYVQAVRGASDAPSSGELADAIGRLNDLLQLAVIQGYLLDRSPDQRATSGLLAIFRGLGPLVTALMWLPGVPSRMRAMDAVLQELFTGVPAPGGQGS